ncbi:hypothetical protein SRABI118_02679 [Massilia sp. Bi118]|uniref:DUF4844 domain-containing protein n=1 Tax=Massilia sp. Bi118 TaxID=2822346 RepID=UPI001DC08D28|nr:DUF4844 domain-containing protein [Massilia sp. Bi118]CAH0239559.1 hypothetical protein SRABI118_02679 [Massilia sp. Bi118]
MEGDDPFEFVQDAPLFVVPRTLEQLRAFREGPKLADLPGVNPSPERERLAVVLDDLTTRLLAGIEAHPTKFWVLKQFQESLEIVREEDTEAREHFGMELERLMEMLGIESSDGVLTYYLSPI